MVCTFRDDGFDLIITNPKTGAKYRLYIDRTLEKIVPEKSKCNSRKNNIHISLCKEKENNWYTLKNKVWGIIWVI